MYALVCIEYRYTFNWKSNCPWCLPVIRMVNQVTIVTKKTAMPSTIVMSSVGIAQMSRNPAVRRLTGSA